MLPCEGSHAHSQASISQPEHLVSVNVDVRPGSQSLPSGPDDVRCPDPQWQKSGRLQGTQDVRNDSISFPANRHIALGETDMHRMPAAKDTNVQCPAFSCCLLRIGYGRGKIQASDVTHCMFNVRCALETGALAPHRAHCPGRSLPAIDPKIWREICTRHPQISDHPFPDVVALVQERSFGLCKRRLVASAEKLQFVRDCWLTIQAALRASAQHRSRVALGRGIERSRSRNISSCVKGHPQPSLNEQTVSAGKRCGPSRRKWGVRGLCSQSDTHWRRKVDDSVDVDPASSQ